MSASDPRRLLDPGSELDPRLRALLRSGRDELPSAERLAEMAARLGPEFAVAPPVAVAKALTLGAVLPRLIVGLAVAGLGGAVYFAVRDVDRGQSPTPAASAAPALVAPPAVSPTVEAPGTAGPGIAQRSSSEPSPAAAVVVKPAATAPRVQRPRAAPVSPPATAPLGELELLDDAQRALGTAPVRALERAETHARHYVHGQYEQEREILAIEALLRLGRGAAAELRAARFLARFPGSSYANRARQQSARAHASLGQ